MSESSGFSLFLIFILFVSFVSSNEYQMFVGQSSFILEGRKVALAERRRHND